MRFVESIKDALDTRKWSKTVDSYNNFMSNHNVTESCYRPETNNCSGGCQGASDCLLARWDRGFSNEPSPRKVRKSKINNIKYKEKLDAIMENFNFAEFEEKARLILGIKSD